MYSAKLSAVAILALLGYAAADCNRFRTQPQLDLEAFMGHWTIDGIVYSQGEDPRLKCMHVELNGTQFTTAPVTIDVHLESQSLDSGAGRDEDYVAVVNDLSNPGNWAVNYGGIDFDFNILSADAEYSLMSLCADVNGVEELRTLLSARSHDPLPESVIQGFLERLRNEFNVDTTNFFPVYQNEAECEHERKH